MKSPSEKGRCKPWHRWQRTRFEGTSSVYRCAWCKVEGVRTAAERQAGEPIRPRESPPPDPDRLTATAYVYFVVADDALMVKIGTTTDLADRLAAIRALSPVSVRMVHTEPGTYAQETDYHHRFAVHRSHGEWFRIEGDLREFLVDLGVRIRDAHVEIAALGVDDRHIEIAKMLSDDDESLRAYEKRRSE